MYVHVYNMYIDLYNKVKFTTYVIDHYTTYITCIELVYIQCTSICSESSYTHSWHKQMIMDHKISINISICIYKHLFSETLCSNT